MSDSNTNGRAETHAAPRLGILCGGGPAPGINSVIGAATICAKLAGAEVVGIRDGFKWLMRGDTELSAVPQLTLKFGDLLQVVGQEAQVAEVAKLVGNSVTELGRTNFITMFLGIGAGVLLVLVGVGVEVSHTRYVKVSAPENPAAGV